MFETYLTAVGRLITAPAEWKFADGTIKVTFRMACNERRYDDSSQTWGNGQSLYLSVTCWKALAEHVLVSLTTGDPVIVRGRVFTRQYEKDGRRGSVVEMYASAVGPDLAWATASVDRARRAVEAQRGVEGSAASGAGPGSTAADGGSDWVVTPDPAPDPDIDDDPWGSPPAVATSEPVPAGAMSSA